MRSVYEGDGKTGKRKNVKRTKAGKKETLEEKESIFSIFCLTCMLVVLHYYRPVCLLLLNRTTLCIIIIFELAIAALVTFG